MYNECIYVCMYVCMHIRCVYAVNPTITVTTGRTAAVADAILSDHMPWPSEWLLAP
ncbi:hypothetical protein BKA80DRAFT_264425 [Phyllosticta citrichinensis]